MTPSSPTLESLLVPADGRLEDVLGLVALSPAGDAFVPANGVKVQTVADAFIPGNGIKVQTQL